MTILFIPDRNDGSGTKGRLFLFRSGTEGLSLPFRTTTLIGLHHNAHSNIVISEITADDLLKA